MTEQNVSGEKSNRTLRFYAQDATGSLYASGKSFNALYSSSFEFCLPCRKKQLEPRDQDQLNFWSKCFLSLKNKNSLHFLFFPLSGLYLPICVYIDLLPKSSFAFLLPIMKFYYHLFSRLTDFRYWTISELPMTYAGILIINLQMQKKIEAGITSFAPSHLCNQRWG